MKFPVSSSLREMVRALVGGQGLRELKFSTGENQVVPHVIDDVVHYRLQVALLQGADLAPAVAGVGLRPEAEGTHGGAAARGVKGDEGVQQERNVIAPDIEIALVDLGDPRQRIQIIDGRRLRIVNDTSVQAVAEDRKSVV